MSVILEQSTSEMYLTLQHQHVGYDDSRWNQVMSKASLPDLLVLRKAH